MDRRAPYLPPDVEPVPPRERPSAVRDALTGLTFGVAVGGLIWPSAAIPALILLVCLAVANWVTR